MSNATYIIDGTDGVTMNTADVLDYVQDVGGAGVVEINRADKPNDTPVCVWWNDERDVWIIDSTAVNDDYRTVAAMRKALRQALRAL